MTGKSPRENALLAYTHHCPERFPRIQELGLCLPPEIRERAPGDGSMEQIFGGTGLDWFGVPWIYQPLNGASMPDHRVPPLLPDICDWRETVKFPDLDAIDWDAAAARDVPRFNESSLHKITLTMGPFERLHSLMGMEEALCALVTDPEECISFFDAVVDHKIRLIDHLVQAYHPDCIEFHDDWGHQNNSFFSPEMFRELLVPPMKRLVDHCREVGVLYEQHCCGYVENLLPAMVDEIGIGIWSSCQSINNVPAIARAYAGRLVMVGGFDCAELDCMNEDEAYDFLSARVNDICRGGVVIPYMARRMAPWQRAIFDRVLSEKSDFYENPSNCTLTP